MEKIFNLGSVAHVSRSRSQLKVNYQLKVKVTIKGQYINKQKLHIMSCPLYNSFSNGRIFFKLE